jgi:hypothetical protein
MLKYALVMPGRIVGGVGVWVCACSNNPVDFAELVFDIFPLIWRD